MPFRVLCWDTLSVNALFSVSARTRDALDETKKTEPENLGFRFDCAQGFEFRNGFWTCVGDDDGSPFDFT